MLTQKAPTFRFEGLYRVQSRERGQPGALRGHWVSEPDWYNDETINALLRENPYWWGRSSVRLAVADVHERRGAFAGHWDALYYGESLEPTAGTAVMSGNVLDVCKLQDRWATCYSDVVRLLDAGLLHELMGHTAEKTWVATAVNEYYLHELGHMTGWDVSDKYRSGYFRPTGRISPALVYMEEFRADCMALHVAAVELDAASVQALIAYHCAYRFGLAGYRSRLAGPGAGAVPFLLYCTLRRAGVFTGDKSAMMTTQTWKHTCLRDAVRAATADMVQLTSMQQATDPVQAAVAAADYFRTLWTDGAVRREFNAWLAVENPRWGGEALNY